MSLLLELVFLAAVGASPVKTTHNKETKKERKRKKSFSLFLLLEDCTILYEYDERLLLVVVVTSCLSFPLLRCWEKLCNCKFLHVSVVIKMITMFVLKKPLVSPQISPCPLCFRLYKFISKGNRFQRTRFFDY